MKTVPRKRAAQKSVQYCVGVGASAGGLEAIHDLFDYMPANTGFSFIIVQHLSPDYKSLMAELLSRHTAMQVFEAQDNTDLQPNCIYVIPSKKLIIVKDNKLRLLEKDASRKPNNAIDVFFESLALDKGKHAVGIVLSGTGTDGTRGLEAIKKNGGFTIVQDPLSAAFDGMPNSAVNSGAADLILPPEMIGEELTEYLKQSPMLKALEALNVHDETVLRDILSMVNESTQKDFSFYKRPTLFRRMAKRMSELSIGTISDYKDYLLTHPEELKELSRQFLINVTKFFRDVEAFQLLRSKAIPAIVANKKPDEPFKVWVVACSSGEEAYTVAILFHEYLAKTMQQANLKIFATDIDSDALEIAAHGVYSEAIQKDVPRDLLEKYFIRESGQYRVSPELRKLVVFASHDILKDPPFSKVDLITCRNMFIYMNNVLQDRVLKKLHFALNLNSYLLLGPSENIGILKDHMHEEDRKWKLYRCHSKSGFSTNDAFLAPLENRVAGRNYQSKNLQNNLAEIFRDTLNEDRAIAGIFVDRDLNVKHAIGRYKDFLQLPEQNFQLNLLKLVPTELGLAIGVAVRKALGQNEKATVDRVMVRRDDKERLINVIAKPYVKPVDYQHPFLCVVLEEDKHQPRVRHTLTVDATLSGNDRIEELERELSETRSNLQTLIEETETANEELQSSNEELISTNEELQSTNEELQSLNEELHTVSAEHQLKIKELLELNDDLNNYLNNAAIGQILVDKRLTIRRFSPAVTKMINVIDADVGRSIHDITTNLRQLDFVNDIKAVIKSGQPLQKEVSLDDNRYYSMRINPFVRLDGSRDGVVVNFIDVTDIVRLNSMVEGVFNGAASGIAALREVRDARHNITDFTFLTLNATAEAIFKLSQEKAVGRSIRQLLPHDHHAYFEHFRKVVESDKNERFEQYNSRNQRWYDVIVVRMLDGVIATYTDITEKRKMTDLIEQNYHDLQHTSQKLVDANAMLERSNFDLMQFASVASHDLKEPLRKIQAFGNLLYDRIQSRLSPEESNYLAKMISSSDRMQVLIEDVLTLSKLSNNGLPHERVNLDKVVKRICDDLEISIREKKARVLVGELPEISAVPGQMRQLFQNLISNALKFNDKMKPTVRVQQVPIAARRAKDLGISPDSYLCIQVSDNGIGFEDIYEDKIFGIFQRLHGRNYEGTGIGLAIARKIVENHRGFITAQGTVNKGAVFSIFLPKDDHKRAKG